MRHFSPLSKYLLGLHGKFLSLVEYGVALICLLIASAVTMDFALGSAFATQCTQYRWHSFAIKYYYGANANEIDDVVDEAEATTVGPGNENQHGNSFDFVKCCLYFTHEKQMSFTYGLINIEGGEIWYALDEAHYYQVSAGKDHGVFISWNADNAFATIDGYNLPPGSWAPWTTRYIIHGVIFNPPGDDAPMKVFNAPLNYGPPLYGYASDIFAHEHGHLHGLEHWEQGDNMDGDMLLQGNLMWAGGGRW
jgi:hypothetical protein